MSIKIYISRFWDIQPVELAKIYTEVRIVPPAFSRLQDPGRAAGIRSFTEACLASHDLHRNEPRSGLDVANDERHQFLSLLGAPGAGKSTFLRYIGLMALRSGQPDAIAPRTSGIRSIALSV